MSVGPSIRSLVVREAAATADDAAPGRSRTISAATNNFSNQAVAHDDDHDNDHWDLD